jgi:hypothetical protein
MHTHATQSTTSVKTNVVSAEIEKRKHEQTAHYEKVLEFLSVGEDSI